MGQVTICLMKLNKKMMKIVEKTGISKSRWIARLIHEKTAKTWPESIIHLSGSWKDMPTAEEIRSGMGTDAESDRL